MTVLVGSIDTTGGADDGFSAGDMVATSYVAAATGSLDTLKVVIRASAFTSLKLGVYADGGTGDPGAKLGEATVTDTTAGTKSVAVSPTISINSGTTYWLALLPLGSFCDTTRTATGGYDVRTGQASLPDPWGTSASDTTSGGLAIQGESSGAAWPPAGSDPATLRLVSTPRLA